MVSFLGINEIKILGVEDKDLFSKYANSYSSLFLVLMLLSFFFSVAAIVLLFFDIENTNLLVLKIGTLIIGLILFSFLLFLYILNFKAIKQIKSCLLANDYRALLDLLQPVDGKQKSEFLSLYAATALGDLHYIEAIQPLTDVLLSTDQVSWGRRRTIAHALAKIGTIKSLRALFQAYSLYTNPERSMHMRSRFEFFHIFRTKRKVKILLTTLAKINHYEDLSDFNAKFGVFSNDF